MLNGWRVYFRFAPPSVSQTSCMTGPRIERSMTYVSPNHLTRWGLVRSTVSQKSSRLGASGAVLASRSARGCHGPAARAHRSSEHRSSGRGGEQHRSNAICSVWSPQFVCGRAYRGARVHG